MFDIDLNRLDEEWQLQPRVYLECADKVAEARRTYNQLKLEADEIKASAEKKIRLRPDKYGLKKTTEAFFKLAVSLHPKVRKANRDLIDAKYELDKLEGELTALEHRKKALEKEVELWSQSYFSTPHIPKTVSQEKQEQFKSEAKKKKSTYKPKSKEAK